MNVEDTAAAVAELFPALYGQLHRRRDPRAYRPSGEAMAVLTHLAASGPLTVSEAARHFDRSQAAISERIERMINRGLLDRIRDERDRRRHLIWLTEAGHELLRIETQVLCIERLRHAAGRMSASDREQLVRSMRLLLGASAKNLPHNKEKNHD